MPISGLDKRLNDLSRTPYKTVLFLNEGHLYKTIHYNINEKIVNQWGKFNDKAPIYIKNHVSVFAFDITNGLSKLIAAEEKEEDARVKLLADKVFFERMKLQFKNLPDIILDKRIDIKEEADSLKFYINCISPEELSIIYRLNSFNKATKTPENKSNIDLRMIMIIGVIAVGVIALYMKMTGRI